HDDEREQAQHDQADLVEHPGLLLEQVVDQGQQHQGYDDDQPDRALVMPELGQDPGRGTEQDARRHHATSAGLWALISRRKAASRSSVPAAARTAATVSSATIRPSRSRISRSQRPASSITWLDTTSVVPASARTWNRFHRSSRSTGSR